MRESLLAIIFCVTLKYISFSSDYLSFSTVGTLTLTLNPELYAEYNDVEHNSPLKLSEWPVSVP